MSFVLSIVLVSSVVGPRGSLGGSVNVKLPGRVIEGSVAAMVVAIACVGAAGFSDKACVAGLPLFFFFFFFFFVLARGVGFSSGSVG